jgi:hypothetical protein
MNGIQTGQPTIKFYKNVGGKYALIINDIIASRDNFGNPASSRLVALGARVFYTAQTVLAYIYDEKNPRWHHFWGKIG